MHIVFKCYHLSNAKQISDVYFIIIFFQLFVEFHHRAKSHKFKGFPCGGKSVVGICSVVTKNDRIAFEV